MKLKPIRFSDGNSEEATERNAKVKGDYAEHGKSYYKVECAFCFGDFTAYKWSLRGGGKRCPHCSALLGSTFQMIQWTALIKTTEGK